MMHKPSLKCVLCALVVTCFFLCGASVAENHDNNLTQQQRRLMQYGIETAVTKTTTAVPKDYAIRAGKFLEQTVKEAINAAIIDTKANISEEIKTSMKESDVHTPQTRLAAHHAAHKTIEEFGDVVEKKIKDSIKGEVTSLLKNAVGAAVETNRNFLASANCKINPKTPNVMTKRFRQTWRYKFEADWAKGQKIILRQCASCHPGFKNIFYKRLTALPDEDLTVDIGGKNIKWRLANILTNAWTARENKMGKDFKLYSSYQDAINDTNAWKHCAGYDQDGVGFPGDCAPTEDYKQKFGVKRPQYNSWEGKGQGKSVSFCIQVPAKKPTNKFADEIVESLKDEFANSVNSHVQHTSSVTFPANFNGVFATGMSIGFIVGILFIYRRNHNISEEYDYSELDGDDNC